MESKNQKYGVRSDIGKNNTNKEKEKQPVVISAREARRNYYNL